MPGMLMVVVATAATYVPARRATAESPRAALQ
jgi:ABC-type lipoprotein release transport system permease subunit